MTSFVAQARSAWNRALTRSYFGSHVMLATGASLFGGLLGLLSGPLAARMLGPHGRGELAAMQAWPAFLLTFSALGLHEATIYFSAREHNQAGRYLTSSVCMSLAMTVPVMLIGYLLIPLLLAAQSPEIIAAGRWYLLLLPLATLFNMPLGALRGRADLVAWNVLRLAPSVGWLLVLIAAGVLGYATPTWILAVYLVMMALLAVLAWGIVLVRIPGPFRVARSHWWPMLRYGLPTMAAQTPQLLNQRFDQILMAALLVPQQLGWYVAAVAWSGILAMVNSGISAVVFPLVAAGANTSDQANTLARSTRLGVMLSLGVGCVLILASPIAIPWLFGADFAPALPATIILVVAGIFYELNGILREGGRGLGAVKLMLRGDLLGFFAGLLTLALLLGPLGIVGAAIASLIGYLTTTVLFIFPLSRLLNCSITVLLRPQREEVYLIWNSMIALMRKRNWKKI